MIVTPINIKSVASVLQKTSEGKKLVSRLFYPAHKKEETMYKNIGIDKFVVTKSTLSTFEKHVIETDFMHGKHFIRVHNNEDSDDFGYSNFRAFLINCGDVVEFKHRTVLVRCGHPTDKKQKANRLIKIV